MKAEVIIPTARLNEPALKSLTQKLEDPKQSFNIHFRNTKVEYQILNAQAREFRFLNVFSNGLLPSRLALFFVPADYRTEYSFNPFQLSRTFYNSSISTIPATTTQPAKKVRTLTYACHLEHVKVYLNGARFDETIVPSTKEDDLRSYVNLMRTSGFFGKPITNSISYAEFLDSSFLLYYDFSTNSKSYEKAMVPCQRNEEMKIHVTFSASLPFEVNMYMLSEFPSTMVIDNHLNVTVTQ